MTRDERRNAMLKALVEDGWESEDWTTNDEGDLVCELDGGLWRIEIFSGWYQVCREEGWYVQKGDSDTADDATSLMSAMGCALRELNKALARLAGEFEE